MFGTHVVLVGLVELKNRLLVKLCVEEFYQIPGL
jgi:hypothetical protein